MRSYIPEKKPKGRRNWAGKAEEQQAVYANRRRVQGEYGKSLLRRRGELVERSFAHCYETGAMRRCHVRGQENIPCEHDARYYAVDAEVQSEYDWARTKILLKMVGITVGLKVLSTRYRRGMGAGFRG